MYWMLLVTNDELIYKRGPQGYRDGRSWAVLFEEQTMPWLPKFLRSMWESVEGGGVSSDGVEGGGFWMLFSELNECNSRRESPWWFLEPGDSCSGRPVPRPCDVGKCEAGNVQIRCSIFAWLMVENNLLVMGEAVLSFAHSASHDFWIEFH